MPLTDKGNKIMSAMKAQYGPKKGESVFYASRNKGTISGVEKGYQFGGPAGMPFGGMMGGAGGGMPFGRTAMPAQAAPAPAVPAGPALGPMFGGMPPVMPTGQPIGLPAPPMGGMGFGGMGRQPAGPIGGWWNNPSIMALLSRFRGGMGGMDGGPGGYGGMKRGGAPRMQSGGLPMMPWFAKSEARNLTHGFLHSVVPGRTDQLPIGVKAGSYVIPSDHLAYLGQGNSLAGAAKMSQRFGMTPTGTPPMKPGHAFHMPNLPRPPRLLGAKPPTMAQGGIGHPTKIVAAGGEMVIPPEHIIRKFGSLEKGHRQLDKEIMEGRKKNVKQLKALRPPKGS